MNPIKKLMEAESGKKLSKDEAIRRIPLYLLVTVVVSIVLTMGLQVVINAAIGGGIA